jgi:gliding motility-associated-like protein
MKKFIFIILFYLFSSPINARHVAGGELFYEWLGTGSAANTYTYKITLRLFRDCNSTGPSLQNEQVSVGIYENNNLAYTLALPLSGSVNTIQLNTAAFPCLVGSVNVCYQVALYTATIDLPINALGYTLARTGCCRINNITNTTGGSNIGSTYITKIPGTNTLPTGHNSSPQFYVKDTALVCAGKNFKLDFGATDVDNDLLTYSFCDAYNANSGSNNSPPAAILSLTPVPYVTPFSGIDPLAGVSINGLTGIISGVAPGVGQYIVSVCITEWRNGTGFTEHRKDFILKVQSCDFIEADLPDKIIQCDSLSVNFQNNSSSSAIQSYLWNFGEPLSPNNISTQPTPSHNYSDTGRYKAVLMVTGPNGCEGIDSTIVIVYPGFTPNFITKGSCFQTPFLFNDATIATYGVVNKWSWNFGDLSTNTDTSSLKNPSYSYPAPGSATVEFFVSSSKGCEKTISKSVDITDKPFIQMPFRDTLICSIDTLQLSATGSGVFSWVPNYNILNATTATPFVFPKKSTTYYITLNEQGCISTDSIRVNTLDSVRVQLGRDSVICKTDTFRLKPLSDALQYTWSASSGEMVSPIKFPLVKPLVNTSYYVNASLGKCFDRDTILIKTVPYPTSEAGDPSFVCFGNKIQLQGNVVGSSFSWSPTNSLINTNTLTPTAGPSKTTHYFLTASDTLGCPKPVKDSVLITVIPVVKVFAGRDTAIVKNQPLQLMAKANFDNGISYLWLPSTGLSNTTIANPIAVLNINADSIKYKVRATIPEGCFGEDEIIVRVFRTEPDIFVPTAFTPNKDGKNDILKPICVGINQLDYFRIYNRWGQLLFETNDPEKGWDGSISGAEQSSGTFVFMAKGTDYTGKVIIKNGTVVLIR